MNQIVSIRDNLEQVRESIQAAAQSVGRDSKQIQLIVVTKGHSLEMVDAVLEAGASDLGENYVEEALPKIARHPGVEGLRWHMIGHVQSRKAKAVSQNFDWVQTVDSLKLARRLNRFAAESSRKLPVLLECNVSGEESKFGWAAWNELEWAHLVEQISPLRDLENLVLKGLMTMAPFFDEPEKARPYFQRLCKLREFLAGRFPKQEWDQLSMGMSGDYQVAIQEGATMVRIGTAILGARQNKEG